MLDVQVHAPMMLDQTETMRLATFVQSQSEALTSWDFAKLSLCWVTSIVQGTSQVAVVWHHPVIHLQPAAIHAQSSAPLTRGALNPRASGANGKS